MITRKFALYTTSNRKPMSNFSIGTVLEYKGDKEYPENDPDWCRISDYVSVDFYARSEFDVEAEATMNLIKKNHDMLLKDETYREQFDHADMLEEIYHD